MQKLVAAAAIAGTFATGALAEDAKLNTGAADPFASTQSAEGSANLVVPMLALLIILVAAAQDYD